MPDAHREDIEKLETLYAEHPEGRIFTHLAEAYRKAGDLDRAAEVLGAGIERHPDYSSAHVVMGRVLVDQGRPLAAEASFERVLELDSHNLVALRALGDLARRDGRTDEALARYRRLLDMEPADDQVRAAVEELTGGFPAAKRERPADGAEGGAGSPVADQEEVEPAFQEPLWLAPQPPPPESSAEDPRPDDESDASPPLPGLMTETIAQVYARQGLYDRAAEVYRELLRTRPEDARLRERLEEVERQAGAETGAEPTDPLPDEWEVEAGWDEALGLDPADRTAGAWEPDSGADRDWGATPRFEPTRQLESGRQPDQAEAEADAEMHPEPDAETDEGQATWDRVEPTEPDGPELEEPAEAGSVWVNDGWGDETRYAEATPYAWAESEPEPQPDESAPIRSYLNSLLSWTPGQRATETGVEDADEARAEDGEAATDGGHDAEDGQDHRAEARDTDPEAAGEAGADPAWGAPERPEDPEEDDDDLETFRSWLENLKQ
jgi:tetratricopeptide (TPR) repeat protein